MSWTFADLKHDVKSVRDVLNPDNYSDYLSGHKIYPRVTAIRVNQAEHKVYVSLQADASLLFPAMLRSFTVSRDGEAEIKLRKR